MEKSKINSLRISGIVFFFLFSITARTQNFSGLQGKELTKIDDTAFALLQFGAKKLDGQIDKVTVIYSGEKTLKLEIHHSGIESTLVSYKIIDSEKKPLSQIKNAKYVVIEGKKPLNVEISLKDNLPEGTEIQSSYLQIDVKKEKKNFLPTTFLYSLEKPWKTEINAENLIIPIKLEPVGIATELRANNKVYAIPTNKQRYANRPNAFVQRHQNQTSYLPLDHFWSSLRTDNYTTANTEAKKGALKTKYRFVRTDGYILKKSSNIEGKAVPLYLYYSVARKDNFVTATPEGIKAAEAGGYRKVRVDGYVLKTVKPQYKHLYQPLWLYYNNERKDNFTIATPQGMKTAEAGGYRKVRIEGYVRRTKTTSNSIPVLGTARRNEVVLARRGNNPNTGQTNSLAQGPDDTSLIPLFNYIDYDGVDFEYPHSISNIKMDIYPDKNLKSGVFYYLPNAYHIERNIDEGYQFKMLYGTADDTSSGSIRMSGTLTPGIGSSEVSLIQSLLKSYTKNNSNYSYKELKIMPLKSIPKVTISSALQGQYSIPSEKITVNMQSEINAPIEFSWVTNNRIKEEMQVALSEGVGIIGNVILEPNSETIPTQSIKVKIALADKRTLGFFTLQPNKWRIENWINNTPYPLKLKYIHALVIGNDQNESVPIIYSWSLGDQEVPAMAKVNFDAGKMPKWLEEKGKSERIWIDYSIVDCESCVNKVMDELTGGTSGSNVKNITFESFQVLETTKAMFLKIQVRSKQVDPKGKNITELSSVKINSDLSATPTGPLYLPEGVDLKYEYYYTLVMSNGTSYKSDNWQSSEELEMYIGMDSLKEAISNLPEF